MSIEDDLIKHKIFLQRYIKQETNLYKDVLQQAKVAVATVKADKKLYLQVLLGMHNSATFARLQKLMNYETDLAAQLVAKWSDMESITPDAASINDTTLGFATYGQRIPLKDAYTKFNDQTIDKLMQADSDAETDTDLLVSLGALTTGLVLSQYDSLSSTAVNTISTDAHEDVFEENTQVIDSIEWSSVLDEATCDDCEALDGTVFDIDNVEEDCPLHANCRCELIPILNND